MSRKIWLGFITIFIIFITLQIISNFHKQSLEEKQSNAPEIIVDLSTINASILVQELERKQTGVVKKEEPVKNLPAVQATKFDSKLPKGVEEIQRALKAAGFNPGKIDGKLGEKTKSAIRAFQKSHDLKVDGKVGLNTWRLLKKYLED